ncbi:MAG: ABC transporter permease [Fluviicola sp.]
MKEYIQLQIRMTNRKFKEMGISPVFAYLIFLVGFIGFSLLLFYKTALAPYFYLLIYTSLILKLSETKRTEFLKFTFKDTYFKRIRLLENLLLALPFFVFLLIKMEFIVALSLLIIAGLTSIIQIKTIGHFTTPTPFSRKPFEFLVGFRKSILIFPLIYALTGIAVYIGNLNLAIFSLLLVFVVIFNFFSQPEEDYFVWIFNQNPKQFLFSKMRISFVYSTVLMLPSFCILMLVYYTDFLIISGLLLIAYLLVITVIVAKYSVFPKEMGLTQGFLIVISLFFPPLLLFVIPYFFSQSVKQLNSYLK